MLRIAKYFILVVAIIFSTNVGDARLRLHGGSVPASFTATWQVFKLGAGGQITGVRSYSDGTMLARTDTMGGYLYVPSGSCTFGATVYSGPCWQQLVTPTTISGFTVDQANGDGGVREIEAAPSNTSILYMLWNFKFWVSTNKGSTWTQIAGVANANSANDGNGSGHWIAVDPNTPSTVFVATTSGISKVTSATTSPSVSAIASIPRTAVIAYDPASSTHLLAALKGGRGSGSTVGSSTTLTLDATPLNPPCTGTGCTISGAGITPGTTVSAYNGTTGITLSAPMTVAAFTPLIWSAPVYESTNGSTFAITTSSPSAASPQLIADKFSQFWLADQLAQSNNVYRFASSAWTTLNSAVGGNGNAAVVATDPSSSAVGTNHVVVSNNMGWLSSSSDNGATWTGQPGSFIAFSATGAQPTWLNNANQGGADSQLNGFSMVFDQSGNLWYGGGIGVWETLAPLNYSLTSWVANTLGVEQLVGMMIVTPSGGSPIAGVWDRGFFTTHNPDVFPSTYYQNGGGAPVIVYGFAVDYASNDPTFVTGWEPDQNVTARGASSTDGGNTFTPWTTQPTDFAFQGGQIAALTNQKWLLWPSVNKPLYYTTNGTSTAWLQSTITGTPTDWGSWGVGYPLAADRVAADTYCVMRPTTKNTYYSTNAGANFTANSTGATIDGSANAFMLRASPTQSLNGSSVYFYTAGGQGAPHPASTHLWKLTKTTNPCDTATSVGGGTLLEVIAFGFGKTKPGASVETMYAYGYLNSTLEFVQSVDGGTTWTAINAPSNQLEWPLNSADLVVWVDGDPDIYGRINVIFRGSGGAYIDTADACPWINWTSTNPNASLTGTVTLTAQHSGLVPVTGVNFYVDGVQIGSTQTGQTSYSVSWNTGGVAAGAHTLKVQAAGNGCTLGGTGNSKSIPITTH